MILKLSITSQAKEEPQNDSWLPRELSPFPARDVLKKSNKSEEITLTLCFTRGQYFLKEAGEWIPLNTQKNLTINNSCITLEPESLTKTRVFKSKGIDRNSKSTNIPKESQSLFGLAFPEQPTAKGDPLDFLKKGAELKPLKPSLINLLVTNEEN